MALVSCHYLDSYPKRIVLKKKPSKIMGFNRLQKLLRFSIFDLRGCSSQTT